MISWPLHTRASLNFEVGLHLESVAKQARASSMRSSARMPSDPICRDDSDEAASKESADRPKPELDVDSDARTSRARACVCIATVTRSEVHGKVFGSYLLNGEVN